MPDAQFDEEIAPDEYLQRFLQEHTDSLKKILCTYVLRMGLARGANVRLVADEAFQDAVPTPTAVLLHWNGAQWTQMRVPTVANYRIYLGSLTVTATNGLWIVGRLYGNTQHDPSQLFVTQWNGKNWITRLQQPAGKKSLAEIAVAGTKVWVIGATYQPNGQNGYTMLNPFIETNC